MSSDQQTNRPRAYAVLCGGGTKAAALAGCVKAAQEYFDFQGYGGTSAGSIIALLAAAGYAGSEWDRLIGRKISEVLPWWSWLITLVLEPPLSTVRIVGWGSKFLFRLLLGGPFLLLVAWLLVFRAGVFSTSKLQRKLHERMFEVNPTLRDEATARRGSITFREFQACCDKDGQTGKGCKLVKMVTADVWHRRPIVYSVPDSWAETQVATGAAASSAYPFVFRPVRDQGAEFLDGGLASNLPVFIFDREREEDNAFLIAFNLIPSGVRRRPLRGPVSLTREVVGTAIDAHDELLRGLRRGMFIYVPVEIPSKFPTFRFRLRDDERKELLKIGYDAAKEVLDPLLA